MEDQTQNKDKLLQNTLFDEWNQKQPEHLQIKNRVEFTRQFPELKIGPRLEKPGTNEKGESQVRLVK
jgi:hypothetical protein